MCKFASFILTKDSEFWGPTDSHSSIIEHHKIHEDGCRGPNVLRVELSPPESDPCAPLENWIYVVDQDLFPEWHDPIRSEERARSALDRRAQSEYWFVRKDAQQAQVGYAGTATAGYSGIATAGYAGIATAGYAGTATAGESGTATAGESGTATAGYAGTATAGTRGTATAGDLGTATAGESGTATAGYAGTATAGEVGIIVVRHWDGSRYRLAVGYVGENGIVPGKQYRFDNEKKQLVEVAP